MKLTDGLFMNTFYEIAKEYPEIQVNDLIVDDLAMKLVRQPDKFQLILLTNLQGDIISDLCAGLVGGLGFAPSANVGNNVSIFEAVHGTAPDIAGKKMANPTSLLLSGIMMLRHVGLISYADRIENALLYTLENGQHTSDFGEKGTPSLNTDEFAKAIADNLGKKPSETPAVDIGTPDFEFHKPEMPDQLTLMCSIVPVPEKLIGADVFIDSKLYAEQLAPIIQSYLPEKLTLKILSNRGTQVWPAASLFTDSVAHYAARLELKDKNQTISQKEILECCMRLTEKLKIADIEFLKEWGDMRGYSLAQGQ
jgi:isocitrate dehydrogenase